MKTSCFLQLLLVILLISCNRNRESVIENSLVHKFYEISNSGDFNEVRHLLSDSIAFYEGSLKISKGIPDTYRIFQWDSVFQPTYEVLKVVKVSDNSYDATIQKACKRINFLMDQPLIYIVKVTVENDKIHRLETRDYVQADWDTWEARKNALTDWTARNHEELDGFVFEQNLKGALMYSKAIDLYEASH